MGCYYRQKHFKESGIFKTLIKLINWQLDRFYRVITGVPTICSDFNAAIRTLMLLENTKLYVRNGCVA